MSAVLSGESDDDSINAEEEFDRFVHNTRYEDEMAMTLLERKMYGLGDEHQPSIDDLEKACGSDRNIMRRAMDAEDGTTLPAGTERRAILQAYADRRYEVRQNAKVNDPNLLCSDDEKSNHAMREYRWGTDQLGVMTRPVNHTNDIKGVVTQLMQYTCDNPALSEENADGLRGYLAPQYVRNQLGNVALITSALSELYYGRFARTRAYTLLFQFLEMTGHPKMRQYFAVYNGYRPFMTILPKQKACLNPSDLPVVRADIVKLGEYAHDLLGHPDIAVYDPFLVGKQLRLSFVMMYISSLWTLSTGANSSHACLRNDVNSLVYSQSGLKLDELNWIDTSRGGCKFTFNYLNKVNPKPKNQKDEGRTERRYFKDALVIDVMDHNTALGLFVRQFEPIAKMIRDTRNEREGLSDPAYLYFNYGQKADKNNKGDKFFGNPVDSNTVTTRIGRVYAYMAKQPEYKMTKAMAACLTGVNSARHVLEAQSRLKLESAEERSDRQKRSGRRGTDHASDGYGNNVASEGGMQDNDQDQSNDDSNGQGPVDPSGDTEEETGSDDSLAAAEDPAASSPQE